jgi:hypothetical protein
MKKNMMQFRDPILIIAVIAASVAFVSVFAQNSPNGTYIPGQYQQTNPNYPKPNPFYFEGRIDWNLLKITTPANTWEFLQRGIHEQDDLDDIPDAINDYQTSLSMNSLQNNTCQIVTAATLVNGTVPASLTPAPCMFTVRLRLGFLLRESDPANAIQLFQEVLQIDPQKIGVDSLIAETWVMEAVAETNPSTQQQDYTNAVSAFQAELALSSVTAQSTALTGDQANNSRVHWELAQVYEALGQTALEKSELQAYVLATKWHSDVYPWRIAVAQNKIQTLLKRAK